MSPKGAKRQFFYKIRHKKTGLFVSGKTNYAGRVPYGKYGQHIEDFATLSNSGKTYQTMGNAMQMITELAAMNAGLRSGDDINRKDFPLGSDIRRAWLWQHFSPKFELVQYAVTEGVPIDFYKGV